MEIYIKIFIAILLALSITFADKFEIFHNEKIFMFMTFIFVYVNCFMPNEDVGILLLFNAYIIVWSIRLIHKTNNKTKIKKKIEKELDTTITV
jgi:hypothetical protein